MKNDMFEVLDIFNDKELEKKFEKKLWDECSTFLETFATTFCKNAADELTKTAEYAISEFYNDYEPSWYDRTYELKNNSYKRYYKNNGRRAWGGVYIGDKYMTPYYKNNNNEQIIRDPFLVTSTAWESGLHGIYGWHTEEGNKGIVPIEIVDAKMRDKKFLKELDNKAYQAAKSESGEILKAVLGK